MLIFIVQYHECVHVHIFKLSLRPSYCLVDKYSFCNSNMLGRLPQIAAFVIETQINSCTQCKGETEETTSFPTSYFHAGKMSLTGFCHYSYTPLSASSGETYHVNRFSSSRSCMVPLKQYMKGDQYARRHLYLQ